MAKHVHILYTRVKVDFTYKLNPGFESQIDDFFAFSSMSYRKTTLLYNGQQSIST